MSTTDPLYSFVFKGILTEEALDKTDRLKKSKLMNGDFDKLHDTLGISELDNEIVLQARRMAVVYTAICAFENSVRLFITKKLLEVKGEDWWNSVSEKIRNKAENRREEESKVRWHTPRGDSIINYTEFGDLVSIIRQNWEHFEPHIISIEWAEQIIKTLERSRNVIMHSGELVNQDIERIGMYIRDWVHQVG